MGIPHGCNETRHSEVNLRLFWIQGKTGQNGLPKKNPNNLFLVLHPENIYLLKIYHNSKNIYLLFNKIINKINVANVSKIEKYMKLPILLNIRAKTGHM